MLNGEKSLYEKATPDFSRDTVWCCRVRSSGDAVVSPDNKIIVLGRDYKQIIIFSESAGYNPQRLQSSRG
jgi:hypothetical protein